jgi:hypothetical protein
MAKELEIQKALIIGTAHIKFETSEWLMALNNGYCHGLSVTNREEGFIIFIVKENIEQTNMPKELLDCLLFALKNECTILILDRDADEVNELETFEW